MRPCATLNRNEKVRLRGGSVFKPSLTEAAPAVKREAEQDGLDVLSCAPICTAPRLSRRSDTMGIQRSEGRTLASLVQSAPDAFALSMLGNLVVR